MSVLDRAIIKAFRRPVDGPTATVALPLPSIASAPPVAARSAVPLSQALAELAANSVAPMESTDAAAAETPAKAFAVSATSSSPVAASIGAMFDEAARVEPTVAKPAKGRRAKSAGVEKVVAATLELPRVDPTPLAATVPSEPQPMFIDPVATPDFSATFEATTFATGTIYSDEPSFLASVHVQQTFEKLESLLGEIASDPPSKQNTDAEPQVCESVVAQEEFPEPQAILQASAHAADDLQQSSGTTNSVTAASEASPPAWRPMLQVDRVIWPSIHSRLQSAAPAAVDRMTDGVLAILADGCKTLGLAGCSSGEGVTTLLLAAAHKLAAQGRRVAIVDANWANPQLAGSLGLLPQFGWEETLGGGLPLEEVAIESLADGLAVLPVREPSAGAISHPQIAASLDILAENFDLVLVDLGTISAGGDEDDAASVAAHVDAIVLVQNVRITTPNRLTEVRKKMAASNLPFAGILQNFVAG